MSNTTLTKATTGPLTGFAVLPLVIGLLLAAMNACVKRKVRYGLGAKAPEHKAPADHFSAVPDFAAIDCSGWVRWAIFIATKGKVLIPDGSYVQNDYFREQGCKPTDYHNCALRDGHVRIAFHRPGGRGGDKTGHVWICYNGFTLESFGGHGPGSRNWDHQWFLDHVDDTYVLC